MADPWERKPSAANTRDGVAAARARGRRGRRPARPSPTQATHARELYTAGGHTVAQIAALLGVPRSTVYGHLPAGGQGTTPGCAGDAVRVGGGPA